VDEISEEEKNRRRAPVLDNDYEISPAGRTRRKIPAKNKAEAERRTWWTFHLNS